jgi:hypothetical protein
MLMATTSGGSAAGGAMALRPVAGNPFGARPARSHRRVHRVAEIRDLALKAADLARDERA